MAVSGLQKPVALGTWTPEAETNPKRGSYCYQNAHRAGGSRLRWQRLSGDAVSEAKASGEGEGLRSPPRLGTGAESAKEGTWRGAQG